MDMQSFGRELLDVLAQRSLELIRNTKMSDVRDVVSGRFLRSEGAVSIATAVGALALGAAIGAGVTALVTPTTGPELRKRVARTTRGARKQAMQLGESVAHQVEHAVESATTAIGLTSPAPKKRTTNGHAHAVNGRHRHAAQA
jgi:gas vesicle protein